MPVSVRVLGDVCAVAPDGTVLDLGGPRQLATLAVLVAAQGRVVPADVLADRVWQGRPPVSAATTLQGHVARLRRLLEPGVRARDARLLLTRGDGYALQLGPHAVDAERFTELLEQARLSGTSLQAVSLLTEALDLWRGPAYGSVADLPALRSEAARLEELRLHAVEQLIAARLAAGQAAELVPELRALAEQHPLREQPQAMLAQALYRAGRQADALEVLRRARERLADELGLDPSPALSDLERALLRQDPALLPGRPVATGPLRDAPLGRGAELRLLQRAWQVAAGGRTSAALVTGEPGIGKTTLLEAFAAGTGRAARWGRFRQAAGAPPYWAWQQVLGGLPETGAPGDGSSSTAERARYLLGLAVADRLRALAADGPLLVVLDDLQWVEGDSLHVLEVVLGELVEAPVLLAVTCRSDALRDGRLAVVLAALARRPGAVRLPLSGLAPNHVGALVAARTGAHLTGEQAERLAERTGGNPFFVGELAALGDSPEVVPDSVREVVRQRLRSLPEPAGDLLAVSALVGRSVPVGILAAALHRRTAELAGAVESALHAGVLEEPAPGELRFSHDLIREAVLADVTAGRRAALQGTIADALEPAAMSTGAWAAVAVARSEAAAGAPDERAAAACLRAAHEALRRAAVDDAAALAARGLVHATTATHAADLWHVRGVACRRGGLVEEATRALEQEATIARQEQDWPRLAAAALAQLPGGIGGWSAVMGPLSTPATLLREAHTHLAALPPADASAVLAALAVTQAVTGGGDAGRLADAAADLAPAGTEARTSAEIARFAATWTPDTAVQRLHAVRQLATSARSQPAVEATALHLQRCAALENGQIEGMQTAARRFHELAQRERDQDLLLLETWWQAGLHQLRGEHRQAQSLAQQALATPGVRSPAAAAVDAVSRETIAAISAWQQGRLLQAVPTDVTLPAADQDPDLLLVRALAHAEDGDADEARRILAGIGDPQLTGLRGTVRTLLLSEVCVAIGETALLARLLPVLDTYGDTVIVLWPGTVSHGPAALYRGAAAQALGLHEQAEADLLAAVELAERIGAAPYADRARARLAGLRPWQPAPGG